MEAWKRILCLLGWLTMVPASAYAQASISGVVKDTSGAVLPGVTVEASSPVLIEEGAHSRDRRHRPVPDRRLGRAPTPSHSRSPGSAPSSAKASS